jgi:hypothetical protein
MPVTAPAGTIGLRAGANGGSVTGACFTYLPIIKQETDYDWVMEFTDSQIDPELVTIRRFSDMSEALLAQGCLRSAGIECFLADVNMSRVDWPLTRGMRLQVSQEDAETAAKMLDKAAIDESYCAW